MKTAYPIEPSAAAPERPDVVARVAQAKAEEADAIRDRQAAAQRAAGRKSWTTLSGACCTVGALSMCLGIGAFMDSLSPSGHAMDVAAMATCAVGGALVICAGSLISLLADIAQALEEMRRNLARMESRPPPH